MGKTFNITYTFTFDSDKEVTIPLNIDSETITLVDEQSNETPAPWTLIDHHKCPHCPLQSVNVTQCPAAKHLTTIVDKFTDDYSHTEVSITVTNDDRQYYKKTALQTGISSITGLIMAASGCPHTEFLKPMARFHLPFSTIEETKYRVLSMYMLKQFFNYRKNSNTEVDWDMEELEEAYENMNILNSAFCDRIKSIAHKDSTINAVVLLSNFAQFVSFSLDDEEMLEHIEGLFSHSY